MNPVFLGIDTSNYTTSAAFYGDGVEINCKKLLPVKEGEVGLRQSDAVFHHTKQLPEVFEKACDELHKLGYTMDDVAAIAVSDRPRNVDGSYMPCFLVGELLARSLAASLNKPLYRFSHQQGHIAAALYSAEKLELLSAPFLAYHLSGGTSEGLYVTSDAAGIPDAKLICNSLDLKAGQAIDRVGVKLGLPFPAGKYMDELAAACSKRYKVKPSMKGASFSLSGVQNKCEKLIAEGASQEEVSAYCLEYIISSVDYSIKALLAEYGELPVLFSGGVSSNSMLNRRMSEKYGAYFAKPAFSADNAFGTAVLASIKYNSEVSK